MQTLAKIFGAISHEVKCFLSPVQVKNDLHIDFEPHSIEGVENLTVR